MAKYNKRKNFGGKNKKSDDAEKPKKEKIDDGLTFEGEVVESLKGRFRVEINQDGDHQHEVLAHLAGKLRRFGIKIVPGDKVNVELSPYDVTRGRITYRLKK